MLAQSKPNVVGYGLPRINTIPGGAVKSFDPNPLYFGCQAPTVETDASVSPLECGVTATAYKNGQQNGDVFDMIFYATGQQILINAPMFRKELPANFKNIDQVTFQTTPFAIGTLLDDISITKYF